MSYTELYVAYEDGDLTCEYEFKNSHGGAMFIWNALINKYGIEGPTYAFHEGEKDRYQRLWDFARDNPTKLRPWELNALLSTYDNVTVVREDMLALADSLDRFKDAHDSGKYVCSLAEQATAIREAHKKGAHVIAWNQTSVNGDAWLGEYNEETDDYDSYNIHKNDDHWKADIAHDI
jgi:hypothetical protein